MSHWLRLIAIIMVVFPGLSKAQTGAFPLGNRCESLFSGAIQTSDFQSRLAGLPYRHGSEDLLQIATQARVLFDNAGIRYQGGPPESLRFIFSPEGTHPANRFAASMKAKLDVDVAYSVSDLVIDGVLVQGAYIRSQKILFLNADFPLNLKIDEVGAHEIAHAYFQNQAAKNGSYLDGSATALAGAQLPVGAGVKAYEKYLRFDELWAHLVSLRIQFQHIERNFAADSLVLGDLISSARHTQKLYKASSQMYSDVLANEALWNIQSADAGFSNLEVATKTFQFSFRFSNKQNPKELLTLAQTRIAGAYKTSQSLLRSLQQLQRHGSTWTAERRQTALATTSATISELRKTMHPLAFPIN